MNTTLSPLSPLKDVIAERRIKALRRREDLAYLRSTVSTLLFIAIILTLFFSFFGFHIVEGYDMFPSLVDGDLALCYRIHELKKNDIVFYEAGGETHCGRVVAKGGDRIKISEDGSMTVNGTIQENEIIYPTYPRTQSGDYLAEIPKGSVFILGDFRTEAKDSRDYGVISVDEIGKKVIAIIRHRRF